ncbi:MAG: hypothetical protein RL032_470 [Pseudomonadota bacterium]
MRLRSFGFAFAYDGSSGQQAGVLASICAANGTSAACSASASPRAVCVSSYQKRSKLVLQRRYLLLYQQQIILKIVSHPQWMRTAQTAKASLIT